MNNNDTICNTIRVINNLCARRFKPIDKNITHMHALVIIVISMMGEKDVFQRDIEKYFCIRRSTATGILHLMERKGLIQRVPVSHDKRLKKLVLTSRSMEYSQKIMAGVSQIEEDLRRGITRAELDSFFAITRKMIKNIDY